MVCGRKITFNSQEEKRQEERRQAAEKIVRESDQIANAFLKLVPDIEIPEEHRAVLPDLADILKMGDTAMMSLLVSVSTNLVQLSFTSA